MSELRLGGARCYLSERMDGSRFIFSLETSVNYRKQGHAKQLLRAIRKWSQRTGVSVGLHPAPFSDRPMNVSQLSELYDRMGFKKKRDGTMWLTPRRKK